MSELQIKTYDLSDDFKFVEHPPVGILRARKKAEEVKQPRLKMVWVIVCQWVASTDDEGVVKLQEFGQFPWAEKNRAEACAELLQRYDTKGNIYRIQPLKVPME